MNINVWFWIKCALKMVLPRYKKLPTLPPRTYTTLIKMCSQMLVVNQGRFHSINAGSLMLFHVQSSIKYKLIEFSPSNQSEVVATFPYIWLPLNKIFLLDCHVKATKQCRSNLTWSFALGHSKPSWLTNVLTNIVFTLSCYSPTCSLSKREIHVGPHHVFISLPPPFVIYILEINQLFKFQLYIHLIFSNFVKQEDPPPSIIFTICWFPFCKWTMCCW